MFLNWCFSPSEFTDHSLAQKGRPDKGLLLPSPEVSMKDDERVLHFPILVLV